MIFRSPGRSRVRCGLGEPETCPKFVFCSSLSSTHSMWEGCAPETCGMAEGTWLFPDSWGTTGWDKFPSLSEPKCFCDIGPVGRNSRAVVQTGPGAEGLECVCYHGAPVPLPTPQADWLGSQGSAPGLPTCQDSSTAYFICVLLGPFQRGHLPSPGPRS